MVRLHRRKFQPELIEDSVYMRSDALSLMTRLLRLAVLLNRGRWPTESPQLRLQLNDAQDMTLEIPEPWLENHPLTDAYLEHEVEMMAAIGHELRIIKS